MYDIVFISCQEPSADANYAALKARFPLAKRVDSTNGVYQAYITASKKCFTKMFWIVWDNLTISNTFDFSYIPDDWDENYIHVFKNGLYFDGILLVPKKALVSQREIEYRFFSNKKEVNIEASVPELYDVVFISYQEPNADENYSKLLKKVPTAKRVNGVKGIHQAHIEAAKLSSSKMFFVVDGDAAICDDFTFDYQVPVWDETTVHVWRSINPVNGLEYGNGGVKLLPRLLTENVDVNTTDMTTSISDRFKVVDQLSNYTVFNTDPFQAWKGAFRECAKLSSKTITRQNNEETEDRLNTWCTKGSEERYGSYALAGANAGREFGISNRSNISLINNFDWLQQQFDSK
jgi:hypothetical protein